MQQELARAGLVSGYKYEAPLVVATLEREAEHYGPLLVVRVDKEEVVEFTVRMLSERDREWLRGVMEKTVERLVKRQRRRVADAYAQALRAMMGFH